MSVACLLTLQADIAKSMLRYRKPQKLTMLKIKIADAQFHFQSNNLCKLI